MEAVVVYYKAILHHVLVEVQLAEG